MTKNYTCIRVVKLQDWGRGKGSKKTKSGRLGGVQGNWEHDIRLIQTDNANPQMLHKNIVFLSENNWEGKTFRQLDSLKSDYKKPDFLVKKAKDLIDECKIKVRSDQVKVMQLMVSVSSEYLKDSKGNIDPLKTQEWMDTSVKFLNAKYGKRVVACVAHMDETTPHISAYLVPIVFKRVKYKNAKAKVKKVEFPKIPRLSAKDLFTADPYRMIELDGKMKKVITGEGSISTLQTEYATYLRENGLNVRRGVRRKPFQTGLKYQTVKEFYEKLSEPLAEIEKMTPEQIKEKFISLKQKDNLTPNYKEKADFYQNNSIETEDLLKAREITINKQKQQIDAYQRKIPLSNILEKLDISTKEETDKMGIYNYRFSSGQMLQIDNNTNKFENLTTEFPGLGNMAKKYGGKGPLDLIIYRTGWDPKAAMEWIADNFTPLDAANIIKEHIENEEMTNDRKMKGINKFTAVNELILKDDSTWDNVVKQTTRDLKYNPDLLQDLYDSNLLHSNSKGNLVFTKTVISDNIFVESGFIVVDHKINTKGIINTFRCETEDDGMIPLAEKDNQAVVLTHDPLEALSIKSNDPKIGVLVISKNDESKTIINKMKNGKLFLAESFTKAGKEISDWVKLQFPFVKMLTLPRVHDKPVYRNWISYNNRPQEIKPPSEKIIDMYREKSRTYESPTNVLNFEIPEAPNLTKNKSNPGLPGNLG